MAVCNIFNSLKKHTGNFLTFSQYSEDLTKEHVDKNGYKVVPSKFMALDIDYTGWDNYTLPILIQNHFENGCALARNNDAEYTPNISSNLFWEMMLNSGLLHRDDQSIIQEIKWMGDINIQSYDEHSGIGYSEIYCYIPNDAKHNLYLCSKTTGDQTQLFSSDVIEGYTKGELQGRELLSEQISYTYTNSYDIYSSGETEDNSFNINTLVILYDIYSQDAKLYTNIPLGIYFTGILDEMGVMSNSITKYSSNSDIYNAGTSYGLRICSRFSISPLSDQIREVSTEVLNENHSELSQVLSSISETTSKLNEYVNKTYTDLQSYKDLYAVFGNNRANVPYIKQVNGKDYWFVNGKMIHNEVLKRDCTDYEEWEIDNYINGIMDFKSEFEIYPDDDTKTIFYVGEEVSKVRLKWSLTQNDIPVNMKSISYSINDGDSIKLENPDNTCMIIEGRVSETTKYKINYIWLNKQGYEKCGSNSQTMYFVHPTYFGQIPDFNIDNLQDSIQCLTKYPRISKENEYTLGSTGTVVLMYPKTYGRISVIKDEYGRSYSVTRFNELAPDFAEVVTTLNDIEYYVYYGKGIVSHNNYILKFS